MSFPERDRRSALLTLAALLACVFPGSAAGKRYAPPPADVLDVPAVFFTPSGAGTADLSQWWTRFSDPTLTQLVQRATAGNLDIAQSAARLVQARESLRQSNAAFAPAVTGSASATRNANSVAPDTRGSSGSLGASWTIDLFGALARTREASAAALAEAGFDLASVRRATAGTVADDYVALRTAQARLAIARDTLRTYDDDLEIAGFRARAGLVSAVDVAQARARREQTAASIPPLAQDAASQRVKLAILIGVAPGGADALLSADGPIPAGPSGIPAGVPIDVLRRRPDVRASEMAVAAAVARVGIARANLYPQLSLTGTFGSPAVSPGALGSGYAGGLTVALAQTLFEGGALRSRVRSQAAAARGAAAAYRASVLGALADVENALLARRSADDRVLFLSRAAAAAEAGAELARNQYQSGLADFQTLQAAEQSLLSARDGVVLAQSDQAIAIIQLYLALGGGWDPTAPLSRS